MKRPLDRLTMNQILDAAKRVFVARISRYGLATDKIALVSKNASWLVGDRLLRLPIGILVGALVARYLGPEQLGLLSYIAAIVFILAPFAGLGLENILVRELVNRPSSYNETIGTSIFLMATSGFLAGAVGVIAVAALRPDESLALTLAAITCISLPFQASLAIRYFFQSRVQNRYPIYAQTSAFLGFSVVRVCLVFLHAPLVAFAIAGLSETLLATALLVVIYRRKGFNLRRLSVKLETAKNLLAGAWPLLSAGVAAALYTRIDHIMLGQMIGDSAVGVYSIATGISVAWYFIPIAVTTSLFPTVVALRVKHPALFGNRMEGYFRFILLVTLAGGAGIWLLSEPLIALLYGQAYVDAASVLTIKAWSGVFAMLGVASSQWLLANDLQRFGFYRTLIGLITNVVLNSALIPTFGVNGAATATLLSAAVAVFSVGIFPSCRPVFWILVRSITLGWLWKSNTTSSS